MLLSPPPRYVTNHFFTSSTGSWPSFLSHTDIAERFHGCQDCIIISMLFYLKKCEKNKMLVERPKSSAKRKKTKENFARASQNEKELYRFPASFPAPKK